MVDLVFVWQIDCKIDLVKNCIEKTIIYIMVKFLGIEKTIFSNIII